jgi:anti-sigma B factor antagonist/stage II sporulation protein AA (anti-sigma F factor antagonist)
MVRFDVHPLPDRTGFALEGELDMASADLLVEVAGQVTEKDELVLDMSGLTFIDSSGLRAVLQVAHRTNGTSGVTLVDPSPAVRRVLEVALPSGAPGLRVEVGRSSDA